jgi:hypothetical protein
VAGPPSTLAKIAPPAPLALARENSITCLPAVILMKAANSSINGELMFHPALRVPYPSRPPWLTNRSPESQGREYFKETQAFAP